LVGSGGGGYKQIIPAGNITSISPASVIAGGPPFTLMINGSGFSYAQYIVFNGGPPSQITGPVTDTQIMMAIDAGMIVNPGSISIYLGSAAPATKPSNTVTLTVNAHTTTACALFGLYHFLFTGFDDRGPVSIVGAFGVDASGNVLGEEDFFDPRGSVDSGQIVGGQCTDSAIPHQGTLALTISGVSSTDTFTYTFVLEQGGGAPHGRLVESGDTTFTTGSIAGSGVFVEVPPGAALSGDYAFGLLGSDMTGARMSEVGRFTDSNGNVSAGVADINYAGTLTTAAPVTGPILVVQDVYLRDVATLTIGGQYHAFDIYVNSSGGGFAIDGTGGNAHAILAGTILSQANAGTYNNGNLNAPLVFSTWGVVPVPTASDTTVGLASGFDSGAGTFNLQFDNVAGGVSSLNQTETGATYSVESNGRATVS